MTRPSSDHDRAELKAALRHAVRSCGGGESVQHVTRVNKTALSRYGSGDHADMHVPLDVALDLDRDAGEPVLLRALARLEGYRLRPAASDGGGRDAAAPLGAIAGLAREHADVIAAITDAHADGALTEAELRRIETEAHELQGALNVLFRTVNAARDAGSQKADRPSPPSRRSERGDIVADSASDTPT